MKKDASITKFVLENFRDLPGVRGLAITGSYYDGRNKENSDLDLLCFLRRKKLSLGALHFRVQKFNVDLYLLPHVNKDITAIPHDRVYSILHSKIIFQKDRCVNLLKKKIKKYFKNRPHYDGEREWMLYHLNHMYEYAKNAVKKLEFDFWIYKIAYYSIIYSNRFKNKWAHGEKAFFSERDNKRIFIALKFLYKTKKREEKIELVRKLIRLAISPQKFTFKENLILKEFAENQWPRKNWIISPFERSFLKSLSKILVN